MGVVELKASHQTLFACICVPDMQKEVVVQEHDARNATTYFYALTFDVSFLPFSEDICGGDGHIGARASDKCAFEVVRIVEHVRERYPE
jgi:hypothetical protein